MVVCKFARARKLHLLYQVGLSRFEQTQIQLSNMRTKLKYLFISLKNRTRVNLASFETPSLHDTSAEPIYSLVKQI